MSFNKYYPNRPEAPRPRFTNVDRALWLRMAGWVSTLMLVTGYVILFFVWT